ncbi:MAG: hypothetical protein ACKVVP_04125 [Chloroflexota bacterium]
MRHTQVVRIEESSPLVYLLILTLALGLIGTVLIMFWSQLSSLMRGLGAA